MHPPDYAALLDNHGKGTLDQSACMEDWEAVVAIKRGIATALSGGGRPLSEFLDAMRVQYAVARTEDGHLAEGSGSC